MDHVYCTNGTHDDNRLHASVLLPMKLYGFANFVDYHLVPYECDSMGLVVMEASSYVEG